MVPVFQHSVHSAGTKEKNTVFEQISEIRISSLTLSDSEHFAEINRETKRYSLRDKEIFLRVIIAGH